jgi:acyl-coenzyme A thioesterase PaaI-like protein
MAAIKHRLHGGCVACGENNPAGLRLKFEKQPDGSVKAAAFCAKALAGYDGLLHGGVAALMLDSAMANCLFSAGVTALTAEITVKYKATVNIGRAVTLTARLKTDHDPLFIVSSELLQDGLEKVSAEAKFMRTVG